MKRVFLPAMIAMLAITNTGCNTGGDNNKTANGRTSGGVDDTITILKDDCSIAENTTIEVVLKLSDEHFRAALIAFEKNDNKACAADIKEGIKSFKAETEKRKGKTKELAYLAEKHLEGLDVKVEKGEVKNIDVLKKAFRKAEHINRQQEFVLIGDLFVPEKQDDIKPSLSKAILDLIVGVGEATGKAKADGEKIIKHGDELQSKLNTSKKVSKKEVDDYVLEVNSWIEKNVKED
ncbi:MAG: hypothetical protein H7Y86_03905 [Rhizobacter sp.]|nr:hypothetical protein [Ferruginibacter sp.]